MSNPIKNILLFLLIVSGFVLLPAHGQDSGNQTHKARILNGDTLPYIELPTFRYYAPRVFANRFEKAKYMRLVRNVKRVYPYARLAGLKFEEYSEELSHLETDAQRRKKAKEIEKEIKREFEGELKRLTISQGHILIKLIDRETRYTSYDVLKDFRGSFSAVFWQSFGRLFGYNLKSEYDPHEEDKLIEEIVQRIEQGTL